MAGKITSRSVGRPRAGGKPPLNRRQVLLTAGRLITEHGYAGTSLRMIADALDTSAPAIAQRFGNKANMLNELVSLMAEVSTKFHIALENMNLSADVRLYKMVHAEVMALAGAGHAPISVFYLPELRQSEFEPAQLARSRMMSFYQGVIEEGVGLGLFYTRSSVVTAEQVFQLTETIIIAQDKDALGTSEQLAEQTAQFVLRGLLVKATKLERIQVAAAKIDFSMV